MTRPTITASNKKERWLPIKGYERDYEVSNRGRVRSMTIRRWHVVTKRKKPLVLLVPLNHRGYKRAILCKDGVPRGFQVSRLVLSAFVGPCPKGKECAHENGIRDDNRVENLAWKTRKENFADRYRHGTAPIGEQNQTAKLSNIQAREILRRHLSGKSWPRLAKHYGVHITTIQRICDGRTFACATGIKREPYVPQKPKRRARK